MAPNGSMGRKTPAAPQKPSKSDSIPIGSLFDDFEGSPKLKADIKSNLPVIKKPGSWDSDVTNGDKKKDTPTPARPSLVRKPAADIARAFPNGKPMSDSPVILKCNHCKRSLTEVGMPKHIERCLNKKQEKSRKKKEAKEARDAAARKEKGGADSDEEEEEKSAIKGGVGASKKRKAVDEAEEGVPTKKKKKRDEPKAKAAKAKAPVDVEKQCGVELPQGGQCARSLTCKSHSMGAKRAVPGRSAPYDKLLMEYQRKNQAKLQKAQFDLNAPDPDDDAMPSGPIDEEQETADFMAGIGRAWGGRPLIDRPHVPLRDKYKKIRINEMLSQAMNGSGNFFGGGGRSGSGSGLFAQPQQPTVDSDGVVHARRPSVAPGARSSA